MLVIAVARPACRLPLPPPSPPPLTPLPATARCPLCRQPSVAMSSRTLTIAACFFLGFGVFWLNSTGYLPPAVSQVSCQATVPLFVILWVGVKTSRWLLAAASLQAPAATRLLSVAPRLHPPHLLQILMVMWVLLMRGLAMPKVAEASKEAFGLDKQPADGEPQEAAAGEAAAAAPSSGGKAGRKAGGKQKQAAAAAASKKDE